jgi:type I restriction enzyme S subunit
MTELPLGWKRVPLDDLQADEPRAITDGPFGSNLARAHYTDAGPRVVRLQNIGDGRFIDARAHVSETHFQSLRNHEVRSGDLLIASLGETLPRACLAPASLGAAIVKADCIRVRLSSAVDRRWVMYSMQRPEVRKWAEEHRHGVGRPRLGLKVIRQIPVPLPPLDEQRRIVDILEDHLSRLDAAIVGTQRAQQRLDAWGLSNLSAMRQASDVERLVELGEIAETALGKMLDAKDTKGTQTPYLRNINVRWGMVDLTDVRTVPLTESERVRLTLLPDDLLVCEGGEPGRTALWNGYRDDMAFQKALHRVRVRDRSAMLPAYLALMLREAVLTKRVDHLFTGTTIKHLPQEKLRRIKVAHPSLAVQALIVDTWEQQTTARDHMQASVLGTERRAVALKRALLQAAFSGRLTGSPSDLDLAAELATHESLEQV